MKLKISEIQPNPFKKHIRNGELNQSRIDILKESIEHGTLPEHFFVRENNNKYELTFGHHRIEALKQVKTENYYVDVTLVEFTDEQMLIDLVRENVTQRDTDYHDTSEGIVLARKWLRSNETDVKQFNSHLSDGRKAPPQNQPVDDSYRSIAHFLSKNGKAVSYVTVKNYLDVRDKLAPDLFEKVDKADHATAAHGAKDTNKITVRDAIKISTVTQDHDEQHDLVKALQNSRDQHGNQKQVNLTKYKEAPDEIKEKVRSGQLDLADVEDATFIHNREQVNKEQPEEMMIFTPNFGTHIKQFNSDVTKLEMQVSIFRKIFNDTEFKTKYSHLKQSQKKNLNNLIFDIHHRIKKCYDEVDFFIEQLPDKQLLEVKHD